MSTGLRLHWSPDSANLVIRIALEELGLAFDAARVDRARAQQRSPEYLRLNPQGLIPVLEDGETVLFETGAILVHLALRENRIGPEGPAADDPAARAGFLKWVFWVSNTLHADLRALFYTGRYIGADHIAAAQAGLAARVGQHLALIEQALGTTGYMAGDRLSLVDIYLACCLRWAQLYPETPALASIAAPRTRALLERLETRPAVLKAFAAEQIAGKGFTAPGAPELPPDQITG